MLTKKTKNSRVYEAVYMLKPTATEEEQKNTFKKINSALADFKGSIHKVETWGSRALAQPVNKFERAFYFHFWFESEAEGIYELERQAKLNPFVLRFYHARLDDSKSLSEHEEYFKDVVLKQAQLFLEKKQKQEEQAQLRASKKPRQ